MLMEMACSLSNNILRETYQSYLHLVFMTNEVSNYFFTCFFLVGLNPKFDQCICYSIQLLKHLSTILVAMIQLTTIYDGIA